MPHVDDWDEQVRADRMDRELRHGEIHRDGPGVWIDNWFYPLGVMKDVGARERETGVAGDDRASVAEGA